MQHLDTLQERSHRPRRVRQLEYSPELIAAVRALREQHPRWGKDRLIMLLRNSGCSTSTATVGRILRRLRERGIPHEPPDNGLSARKR